MGGWGWSTSAPTRRSSSGHHVDSGRDLTKTRRFRVTEHVGHTLRGLETLRLRNTQNAPVQNDDAKRRGFRDGADRGGGSGAGLLLPPRGEAAWVTPRIPPCLQGYLAHRKMLPDRTLHKLPPDSTLLLPPRGEAARVLLESGPSEIQLSGRQVKLIPPL